MAINTVEALSCCQRVRLPAQSSLLCILIHNKEQVLEHNSGSLIRMLLRDGWVHVATKGSHWQFRHPAKPGRVTVPHPNKDIPHGTVASIYRQAGWNR